MTPEQIEEARLVKESEIAAEIANDPLTKLQEENARLLEERDNYKKVALTRKGKLPGDADFFKEDGDEDLSVAEQIRIELNNKEILKNQEAERVQTDRLKRENAELRLALKNRPGSSMGSDSGSGSEPKDNTFSPQQLEVLKNKAIKLKADPEKFIERAKQNLMKGN